MNADPYQIPTLALMVALIAVFGGLWLQWLSHPARAERSRESPSSRHRHLMWLAGWTLTALHLVIAGFGRRPAAPWLAVSLNCMVLAPLMFLGSLASQYFTRRLRIPFIFAFGAPLVVFATTIAFDPNPGAQARIALLICAVTAIYIGAAWGLHRNLLPVWLSLILVAAVGVPCLWLTLQGQYLAALHLVSSGTLAMAALLFASAFRRVTAGMLLTVGGLTVWALIGLQSFSAGPHLPLQLVRAVDLVQVLTAVGMIVLTLEDEIAVNRAAQLRDQRARWEMERYSGLYVGAMPYTPEHQEYDDACRTIAEASRFARAAVFLRSDGGTFWLAGHFGLSTAEAAALDAIARRTSDEKMADITRLDRITVEAGHLVRVDLSPSILPEDQPLPEELQKPRILGIRVRGGGWQGVLLLAGLRNPRERLRTEDVLPLELLVTRIGAAREHAALLRRLMQSERLAGLGQLASGVAHELNNPLTAVTGYAELLTDADNDAVRERAQVILNEARRMKKIIESLVRFRKLAPAGRAPFSVELLARDIEKLARHDLESARVRFRILAPAGLPRAMGDGEQIRQVFLQLLRNAITSLEEVADEESRQLTVEMLKTPDSLRIIFSDTGTGFPDPARAFDPFLPNRQDGAGVGLGLSLCYSIVHEQGGDIVAENLYPHGARVVIDLPVEEAAAPTVESGAAGTSRAVG